jgi:hypothetical protein
MSNKRIKKQLDHIFDNLQQAESETSKVKKEINIAPSSKERVIDSGISKPVRSQVDKALGGFSAPEMGTRPLGPIPETLARIDQSEPGPVLTVPFRTDTNSWSILEAKHPQQDRLWSQEEQILVKQVTDQLSLALENLGPIGYSGHRRINP